MKTYLLTIKKIQTLLLGISIGVLMVLPIISAYFPTILSMPVMNVLFAISLSAVFFVMSIRPLADIFPTATWIRALVILRKGFGVFSASIIVSFFLGKIMAQGLGYLSILGTPEYWSLTKYALFAHLGDLTGIILLITSNTFSKRMLGPWWKRIQKLAYVYFYAGALYEFLAFYSGLAFVALSVVTLLVLVAFTKNMSRRLAETTDPTPVSPQTI